MNMNHQSKAAMEAGNALSAAPALQGDAMDASRRATGDAGAAAPPIAPAGAESCGLWAFQLFWLCIEFDFWSRWTIINQGGFLT